MHSVNTASFDDRTCLPDAVYNASRALGLGDNEFTLRQCREQMMRPDGDAQVCTARCFAQEHGLEMRQSPVMQARGPRQLAVLRLATGKYILHTRIHVEIEGVVYRDPHALFFDADLGLLVDNSGSIIKRTSPDLTSRDKAARFFGAVFPGAKQVEITDVIQLSRR